MNETVILDVCDEKPTHVFSGIHYSLTHTSLFIHSEFKKKEEKSTHRNRNSQISFLTRKKSYPIQI